MKKDEYYSMEIAYPSVARRTGVQSKVPRSFYPVYNTLLRFDFVGMKQYNATYNSVYFNIDFNITDQN